MRRVYRRRRIVALLAAVVLLVVAFLAVRALGGLIGGLGGDAGGSDAAAEATAATTTPGQVVAADAEPYREAVPILMYHDVDVAPPGTAYPELFVSPGQFDRQLDLLAEKGYEPITMAALELARRGKAELPAKPIVLTFDDGYRGQYENAAKALAERGWPGVLYLKVDALTQGEMTKSMVARMIDGGWELGSHTVTHPDLTTLDPATLEDEVSGSRQTLARRFGVPVDSFCYPAGSFDATVVDAVRKAGYTSAVTVEDGLDEPGGNRFEMPRIRIDGGDGVGGLREKLRG